MTAILKTFLLVNATVLTVLRKLYREPNGAKCFSSILQFKCFWGIISNFVAACTDAPKTSLLFLLVFSQYSSPGRMFLWKTSTMPENDCKSTLKSHPPRHSQSERWCGIFSLFRRLPALKCIQQVHPVPAAI